MLRFLRSFLESVEALEHRLLKTQEDVSMFKKPLDLKILGGCLCIAGAAAYFSVELAQFPGSHCRTGSEAVLAADSCVNVWPVESPKFRWPDLDAGCPKGALACDSLKNNVPESLSSEDCAATRLLKLFPKDRLAMIECENYRNGRTRRFYINQDELVCTRGDVSEYRLPEAPVFEQPPSTEVGARVVDSAEMRMTEMGEKVIEDTRLLEEQAKLIEPQAFLEGMRGAHVEIGRLLFGVTDRLGLSFRCERLDGERSSLDGEEVRAQRSCRLLRGAYILGSNLLRKAERLPSSSKPGQALLELIQEKMELTQKRRPNEALAARMWVFYALKMFRPELSQELNLIRVSTETGERFWELHAGFVFGGHRLGANSGGGYDCTEFIASLLDPKERGLDGISTRMLKRIARHGVGEAVDSELSNFERRLASCFQVIDFRAGDELEGGDFVVSSSEIFDNAHATIVKRVLPEHEIETIEATGGGNNAIMYKRRPLLEPQPQCQVREKRLPMRSDLYVLRLKAAFPRGCPLLKAAS